MLLLLKEFEMQMEILGKIKHVNVVPFFFFLFNFFNYLFFFIYLIL